MNRSFTRCCFGIQGSRSPSFDRSPTFKNITKQVKGNDSLRSRHGCHFISEASFFSRPYKENTKPSNLSPFLCLAGLSLKRLTHNNINMADPPTLETLTFDNLALRSLPVDPNVVNTQRQVSGACFSRVSPTPVDNPVMVASSLPALELLDISESESQRPEFTEYFSGNKLIPGSEPAAHCYCGHQFGYFSGQLGDGAAMYLGEVINKSGQRWEIQLKGAGLTPYSRTADGRKVLRSTIREFLCSEAIHNLGIPTTRAGTCITSDSTVVRDIFYDGHPINERCTIVLRIAPTFIRFGSFEIFKPTDSETRRQGPSVGRTDMLHSLMDYTIQTFYPEIWSSESEQSVKYLKWYEEVVRRTARMVAHWQCVGWCHGVLNTDNMSIVGVTIDYGPYGFMDRFDPEFICNGSDDGGRYSYKNQPSMCRWNCMKLGEAIQDALPLSESQPILEKFDIEYEKTYTRLMRAKLGLHKKLPQDSELVSQFLSTMEATGADFTNSWRCLSDLPLPSSADFKEARDAVLKTLLMQSSSLEELKLANQPKMDKRQFQMFLMIAQTNPEILTQLGRSAGQLRAEVGRMERLQQLEETSAAEVESRNREKWDKWLNKYTDRLEKEEEGVANSSSLGQDRVTMMNSANPKFILRNYIAQAAIDKAEKGDYSEVQRVLALLQTPYSSEAFMAPDSSEVDNSQDLRSSTAASTASSECGSSSQQAQSCHSDYAGKPPRWAQTLKVT